MSSLFTKVTPKTSIEYFKSQAQDNLVEVTSMLELELKFRRKGES